jgi:8-hydroxy-5-deazaflavin:NADPH oxidoreductase
MRIAVLGTGQVGRTLAGRCAQLGHDVVVGTRDPRQTMARTDTDAMGTPPYAQWQAEHPDVALATNAEAGAGADLVVNATNGSVSQAALTDAGVGARDGLVVLDVANVLEFGAGPLPGIGATTEGSLGERLQAAFPAARMVKALNTMNCAVMVDPARVPGDHVVFVAGDDAEAKAVVQDLLGEFGWGSERIVDLGGIVGARATEMYIPLWLSLMGALGTPEFNIALAR